MDTPITIRYVMLRDREGRRAVEDKPIRIMTPDEINAFLDAVDDPKYNMLFRLAIMSGARQGELLGLKWSDIDWINNQIQHSTDFQQSGMVRAKVENVHSQDRHRPINYDGTEALAAAMPC